MQRQVRNPKRADSDLLARLCKRYGLIVLAAIAAGNAGIRKGSLKARLIEYYYQLDGEWSREREKADWKGHDLATLKYETTRLLVAVLARNAPVGNQDLYQEIAEINWAIAHEAFNVALNISRTAQTLALIREEYGILHELLDCEERVLERLDENDLMADHLRDCADRQEACFIQLKYTHECAQIRKRICDPIKKVREAGEVVPKIMVEQLQQALEGIDCDHLEATAAKVDYFSACILCDLLLSDLDTAMGNTESLLVAYEAKPWYVERHPVRYIRQLCAASMLYSKLNRFADAERIIEGFSQLKKRLEGVGVELQYSQAICAIVHSLCSGKRTYQKDLISGCLENEQEFDGLITEREWLQLVWLGMVRCLAFDEFRFAYQLGRSIVRRKASVKKNILVAARIALFACEAILYSDDEELINYSFTATDNFLKRNGKDHPQCRFILKAVRTSWLSTSYKENKQKLRPIGSDSFHLTDKNGNVYYDFAPLLGKFRMIF